MSREQEPQRGKKRARPLARSYMNEVVAELCSIAALRDAWLSLADAEQRKFRRNVADLIVAAIEAGRP